MSQGSLGHEDPEKPSSGRDQPEKGEGGPGSGTHVCQGPGVGMNLTPAGSSEEGVARTRVARALQQGSPRGPGCESQAVALWATQRSWGSPSRQRCWLCCPALGHRLLAQRCCCRTGGQSARKRPHPCRLPHLPVTCAGTSQGDPGAPATLLRAAPRSSAPPSWPQPPPGDLAPFPAAGAQDGLQVAAAARVWL